MCEEVSHSEDLAHVVVRAKLEVSAEVLSDWAVKGELFCSDERREPERHHCLGQRAYLKKRVLVRRHAAEGLHAVAEHKSAAGLHNGGGHTRCNVVRRLLALGLDPGRHIGHVGRAADGGA